MPSRRPVRRVGARFEVRLSAREREALRTLPPQLRELLQEEDPSSDEAVARLFPPAYRDDPIRNLEYEHVASGELLGGRLTSLDTMERTLDAPSLTEEELLAWLGVVNDSRLVLGTRLGVTEESTERDFRSDPQAATYGLYVYLSWLLEAIVDALGAS